MVGFGGPVALVGYMQRDLVERHGWVDDREYKLALALAQIMTGPLAAKLAIALGYFLHCVPGATLVGLDFVLRLGKSAEPLVYSALRILATV